MAREAMRPDTYAASPRPDSPARKPGRPRWLSRVLSLVVVTGLIGGGVAGWKAYGGRSSDDVWEHNLARGLNEAHTMCKRALVYFTADWCPPCRALEQGALADPRVIRGLEHQFVLVKVDLTDRTGPNQGFARQFSVNAIPTVIVFDMQGNQLERIVGGEHMDSWFRTRARQPRRAR